MRGTGRLEGLDAARGLAVVSMLVAHLCPVGGPFVLSEYLTAPLFAVIMGASMGLALTRRRPAVRTFLRDNAQRGLLLVVLGLLLQGAYDQISVVLPYLGVLVITLAPLALLLHRKPVLTLAFAAVGALVGPAGVTGARLATARYASATSVPWWFEGADWVATGHSYRLLSFLPMALGGLALAHVLRRGIRPRPGITVAVSLAAGSLMSYLLGRSTVAGAAPYSGTSAEVLGATLLGAAAVVGSFVAVDLARPRAFSWVLEPLLSTGRLALTGYTVQILFLAVVATARGPVRDDSWLVLGATTCVVVGGCWLLERWLGTGPVEWVVHALRPRARAVRPAPSNAALLLTSFAHGPRRAAGGPSPD